MSKTKYKKQNKKINNKAIAIVGVSLQKMKRSGYVIPTMNCYPRNAQLRDPDFTCQKSYSKHLILCIVLNLSTIVLRASLIKMQSQLPIKEVGLARQSKTSLVRNCVNIKYKMQKLCNKNLSMKFTDLLQTQRLIES